MQRLRYGQVMQPVPRILHVFSTFDHGGAEARTVRLINHFARELHHTVIVGNQAAMGAAKAITPGLAIEFPRERSALVEGRPGLRRYYRLAQAMAGFDLVLTYSWGAMDAVMAHRLFARALRLPPLIHHEDGFGERADEEQATLRSRMHSRFRKLALQRCHALVVPSRQLETLAGQHWGMDGERLARIANGIAVENYTATPQPGAFPGLPEADRGARQGVVVGTIAGLRRVKNLSRLVRAVASLPGEPWLAIAGTGEDREAILAEASRTGLGNRLLLPGFLPDPARYVGLFDIFALSSDSEQFPIALVEAMAAGLPIAAPAVGDIAAIVSAENRPFIVAAGDEQALAGAIAALAADPAARQRIGAANAAHARLHLDETAMFQRFRQLYGDAMKRADFEG